MSVHPGEFLADAVVVPGQRRGQDPHVVSRFLHLVQSLQGARDRLQTKDKPGAGLDLHNVIPVLRRIVISEVKRFTMLR
jgi:hypothetical protein